MKINNYSINLLWFNNNKPREEKFIYPCNKEEILIEKYLYSPIKWTKANPTAEVNIWYDSEFTSLTAVENTKNVINSINCSIKLKNFREIEVVKKNFPIFSEGFPFYCKIDTAKLIICYKEITEKNNEAVIFTDLLVGDERPDKERMGQGELFCEKNLNELDNLGMLNNCIDENQFLFVIKNNYSVAALKHSINICLNTLENTIKAINNQENENIKIQELQKLFLIPFRTTINYVQTLYKGLKGDKLKVNKSLYENNDQVSQVSESWSFEKHGYDVFGNINTSDSGSSYFCLGIRPMKKILKAPKISDKFVVDVDVRTGGDHYDNFTLPIPEFKASFIEENIDISGENTKEIINII